MGKEVLQDSIEFALIAETTVVNTTVKLIASISGMLTSEITEPKLRDNIRTMLKNLIADATWNISGMSRTSTSSGWEQIDLQASTRVSEKENYALDKRSRDVSQEGLRITSIYADTTPPASMIEASESSLRVDLLRKANVELEIINAAMDGNYRVGNVSFQSLGDSNVNFAAATRGGMAMAKTSSPLSYGSGFSNESMDDDTLGNAVKLTMRANIAYRRIVKT